MTTPENPGWSVTPGDGSVEGERLVTMNEILRALPHAPGTVQIWFDDRPVVAEVTFEPQDGGEPPDLVSFVGEPPDQATSLAQVLADSLEEG